MGAIEDSIPAPAGHRWLIVAAPIGDCHHISRWVVTCGARHLGYQVILLGEIDADGLAQTCHTYPDATVMLTWLLTPSQTQFDRYLNKLNDLTPPPRLILGGLTVSERWVSEMAPLYSGRLAGAHSALALLRMLRCAD